MILHYDAKHGEAVRDGDVFDWIRVTNDGDILNHERGEDEVQVLVGSQVLIDAARLMHARGMLHLPLRIMYKGLCVGPDENGRITSLPEGFCRTMDDILMALLDPDELAQARARNKAK
jgi:hypothetical protein